MLPLLTLALLSSAPPALPALCPRWEAPERIGTLERALLPEESGMAFSNLEPDRLYHVNDSGNGPFFLYTDARGADTKKVRIAGYEAKNSDFEAISTARVDGRNLLFVADIGDNSRKWQYYELLILEERPSYGEAATPLARVRIRYPDGKGHDAEGFAVHPSGDLFVLTKEGNLGRLSSAPSHLYRLPKAAWTAALEAGGNKEPLALEPWGTLDLPALAPGLLNLASTFATDLSIRPDGKAFLVLTYGSVFEFASTLERPLERTWQEGQTYQRVPVSALEQQEALAYLPSGKGFVYSGEVRATPQPLMRVRCGE